MEFSIKHTDRSINDIMRLIGYQAAHFQKEGEFSIVRPFGRNGYPRFHLYGERKEEDFIIFKLYLDQKNLHMKVKLGTVEIMTER